MLFLSKFIWVNKLTAFQIPDVITGKLEYTGQWQAHNTTMICLVIQLYTKPTTKIISINRIRLKIDKLKA